jgi:hypothetical protein
LDYPREDFIGRTLWDIGPFRNIEASKEAFRKLQDKEYGSEQESVKPPDEMGVLILRDSG